MLRSRFWKFRLLRTLAVCALAMMSEAAQHRGGQAGVPTDPHDLIMAQGDDTATGAPDRAESTEPDGVDETVPGHTPKANGGSFYEPPKILTDLSVLPFPVRRMRELLIEAARSGDIEKLRPYIGSGDDVTLLSFGGGEGDPITFLKSISGDSEGREILAILLEVLEAGFVRLEAGTENEMYVWPYFFAVSEEQLTPPQRVELFKLLTYGDYQEMVSFGAYFFYRVGITPQGRWRFFVAGD